MKKVEPIKLHNARNGEHYDFMAIVAATFNQSAATTLNLTPLYNTLHTLFQQEDAAMKIIRSSQQTPAIQQFEKERTKLYRFLYQTIKMSTKLPDPATNQAAQHLLPLIKTYKGIRTNPQRDRSGLITNLVDDLQLPTNTTAIAQLNLTATVEQLKTKNQLFIESYMARADEKEQKKAVLRMSTIRPLIDQAYNTSMEMLNATYATNELNPSPDPTIRSLAGQIINLLDANVQEMNLIIATRRHRAKKQEKRKIITL